LLTRIIFWGAPKKVGALSYSLCSLYVNPELGLSQVNGTKHTSCGSLIRMIFLTREPGPKPRILESPGERNPGKPCNLAPDVMLVACILKGAGSNLCRNIEKPGRQPCWFPSIRPANSGILRTFNHTTTASFHMLSSSIIRRYTA
jgi:hypothetical protein